jgi:hypothetical protein
VIRRRGGRRQVKTSKPVALPSSTLYQGGMMKNLWILSMLCAGWLAIGGPLQARQAPPFGDSLTWDTGKEAPALERLRGKSVLIVFFQDWCGICNRWSGDMFRQVGEAYADDPTVALIAIKTDGGSLRDAHDYLKTRTDLRHWMVAVDENATYYRQATGQSKLYKYLWISPDGKVGEFDDAGNYYDSNGGKSFALAAEKSRNKYRKDATALMTMEPPLADGLGGAVTLAERGLFLAALAEVAKVGNAGGLAEDAARFRKRISDLLMAAVKEHKAVVEDEANENRYLSYLALEGIERDFGKSPPGLAAREVVSAEARAAWLDEEKDAESQYKAIMKRAARADDERGRERIARALKKLAEEHPDTVYGRMAAAPPAAR